MPFDLKNEQNDSIPPSILDELQNRFDECTLLEKDQMQMGTTVPQLYASIAKFVANPSTVSVETFKRMRDTDETLGAGLEFLRLAMIARMGDYKHPSKEITEFVKRCLDGMDCSWHGALNEMFDAEGDGFSATEKIWTYDESFGGMPAFRPKNLITYPPLTVVFAVDRHGELLPEGIHQFQRYHQTSYLQSQGFTGAVPLVNDYGGFRPDLFASVGDFPYPIRVNADLSFMTMRMPRHKMIHLTSSLPSKGNPYGTSLLRRAYKSWVTKDAVLKMWLVAADRKGTPLLVAYADPHVPVAAQVDRGGTTGGENKIESLPDAMNRVLKNIHNSSFVVVPGKKTEVAEIDSVDITGDMNVFKDFVDYLNKAEMRSMLIPPLLLGGDGGGSFALGDVHKKVWGQSVDGKLKPYKQGIKNQFIKQLIAYNFPKSAWEKDGLGDFVLEEYDPEMMERLANVYGNITTAGYMSPEDQVDMDEVRTRLMVPPKAAKSAMPLLSGIPSAEDVRDDPNSANAPPGKGTGVPAAGDPAKPGEEANMPGQESKAEEEEENEAEHPIQLRGKKDLKLLGNGFKESDHPRADDGKFGSGGGGVQTNNKDRGSGEKINTANKSDGIEHVARVTPDQFVKVRDTSKRQSFLSPTPAHELKDHELYVTQSGAGYALSPEKDLQGVFNNSTTKGAGRDIVIHAISVMGAKTLDCFDDFLPKYYARFGFIETKRMAWSDEYAPKGWDYEKQGRPDVIYMEYPESLSRDESEIRARFEAARPDPKNTSK